MGRTQNSRGQTMTRGNGNARDGNSQKRSSDEIRREIDHTRHEMDETLDELYARLHPVHLLNDLLGYATRPRNKDRIQGVASRGRYKAERARANAAHKLHQAGHAARRTGRKARRGASSAGQRAWNEVREHPVPALLVAAGVGLYLWRRRQHRRYVEVDVVVLGEQDFAHDGYGPEWESRVPSAQQTSVGWDRSGRPRQASLTYERTEVAAGTRGVSHPSNRSQTWQQPDTL